MEKINFLVVDTETGGLDHTRHSLLEIGASVFNLNGEKLDSFHAILSLAQQSQLQGKKNSLYALKLNQYGIGERIAEVTKSNKEIADDFVAWLIAVAKKFRPILVGQNIKFDIRFIDTFLLEQGYEEWSSLFGNNHIDTITMAQLLQICQKIKTSKLSLSNLAEEFSIENENAHTAMSDVDTTAKIFIKMLEKIGH